MKKSLEELIQEQFDGIVVPPELNHERTAVWKAGIRRSIQAVNAAFHIYYKGDHDEQA